MPPEGKGDVVPPVHLTICSSTAAQGCPSSQSQEKAQGEGREVGKAGVTDTPQASLSLLTDCRLILGVPGKTVGAGRGEDGVRQAGAPTMVLFVQVSKLAELKHTTRQQHGLYNVSDGMSNLLAGQPLHGFLLSKRTATMLGESISKRLPSSPQCSKAPWAVACIVRSRLPLLHTK